MQVLTYNILYTVSSILFNSFIKSHHINISLMKFIANEAYDMTNKNLYFLFVSKLGYYYYYYSIPCFGHQYNIATNK